MHRTAFSCKLRVLKPVKSLGIYINHCWILTPKLVSLETDTASHPCSTGKLSNSISKEKGLVPDVHCIG